MSLTDSSGDDISADEKARRLLGGIAVDETAWNEYPPSLDELEDKVGANYCEDYFEQVENFSSLLEEDEESELSQEELAARFKVGMHLTGNFIRYEDAAEIYDAEFNDYNPGSGELWSQSQSVKEFIDLDEHLKKESVRYNSL